MKKQPTIQERHKDLFEKIGNLTLNYVNSIKPVKVTVRAKSTFQEGRK